MMKAAQNQSREGARTTEAATTSLHARSRKPLAHSEARLARLESAHGNQHLQRLLNRGVLQAKLTVNRPGDVYEQEADRVGDAVMRMPDPRAPDHAMSGTSPLGVQRCACGKSI